MGRKRHGDSESHTGSGGEGPGTVTGREVRVSQLLPTPRPAQAFPWASTGHSELRSTVLRKDRDFSQRKKTQLPLIS